MASSTQDRIENMIVSMPGANRFDKLIDIRDVAQRLIKEEKAAEEAALKSEVERLAAELSSKRARVGNLAKVVRGTEPRKRRKAKDAK
jgi:hypothetical protein